MLVLVLLSSSTTVFAINEPTKEEETLENSSNEEKTEIDSKLLDSKIIRVATSSILTPIISKFADNFHGQISIVKLDSDFDNESDATDKLCSGNQDVPILMIHRKLNNYEKAFCRRSAKTEVIETKIGYYAMIIAANKNNKFIDLSSKLIYKAISQNFGSVDKISKNSYTKWSDISKNLPNTPIQFYGPFVLSASYSFLINKTIFLSCLSDKYLKDKFDKISDLEIECKKVRSDSKYVGDRLDSRLTLSKLFSEKDSYGFIHYGIYELNKTNLQTIRFNGVEPSLENIYKEEYQLSFPIYLYVKKNKLQQGTLPYKLYEEIKNVNAIGKNGYLKDIGLIPKVIVDKN